MKLSLLKNHITNTIKFKKSKKKNIIANGFMLIAIMFLPLTSHADKTSELKRQEQDLRKEIKALQERIIKAKGSSNEQIIIENAVRMNELERSLWSLEERIGQRAVAQVFDGIRMDIGGFFHTAYTSIDAENGSEASFDRQNFELLIGAELDENWSAFFAGGFLRESDLALTLSNRTAPTFNSKNKNPQIIGWVNYAHSSLVNVRIGRMITPHGIINVEHFPATLLDPEQPQFLRPFSGDTIFPNFATGIQVHGKKYFSSTSFEYATYATNMSSNADALQVGGRSAFGFNDDKIVFGLNYASGTRVDDIDYTMSGLDFKLKIGLFSLKSEYYVTSEDSTTQMTDTDREALYIQPAIHLSPKWILFTRLDELNMGDLVGESTETAIGINFLPSDRVRLRAIFTSREYEGGALNDADADILQISGTFSF